MDYSKLKEIQDRNEQKPAEWSDSFEENIRILLHDKLTWHSEDGSMSSTTLIDDKTLRDIVNGIWFYVGKETLKYPNKELNATEWSEEDKAMIERLIRHTQKEFDELCNDSYGHQEIISDLKESCLERMNWLENRLKSLRPQPHWKPSEEQMEALNTLLCVGDFSYVGQAQKLQKLYIELKKL